MEATDTTTSLGQRQNLFHPLGVVNTFLRVIDVFLERWMIFVTINAAAVLLNFVLAMGMGHLIVLSFMGEGGNGGNRLLQNNGGYANNYYNKQYNYQNGGYQQNGGFDYSNDSVNGDDFYDNSAGQQQGGSYYSEGDAYDNEGFDNLNNPYYVNGVAPPLLNPVLLLGMFFTTLVCLLVFCLADGTTIRAVAEIYCNQVPSLQKCFLETVHKVAPLATATLILGCVLLVPYALGSVLMAVLPLPNLQSLEGLAMILLLIFLMYTVYVTIVCFHTYPVIMVEGLKGWDSIHRSMRLSEGQFGHVFLVLALYYGAKLIINVLISSLLHENNGTVEFSKGQQYDLRFDANFGSTGDSLLAVFFCFVFATFGSMYVPYRLCYAYVLSDTLSSLSLSLLLLLAFKPSFTSISVTKRKISLAKRCEAI